MYTESFENLIYGDDGVSPIRGLLVRVLDSAKKDGVRLRIDIRSCPLGTSNSRNEHALFVAPDESDADGIMRILVERLNDSPGEGFLGQVRLNFGQAGSSGERYASWTRTLRAPNVASRVSTPSEDEGESVDDGDGDENQVTSFRGHDRGDGEERSRSRGVWLSEDRIMQERDTMMGYIFRSQAQQFAMFERATRMMESYTLRFGFPTHEPGIIEARGGEVAPGSPGPAAGNFGVLPMLVAAVGKIMQGGNPEPAPVAAQVVSANRSNGRAAAISGAGRSVRALRGPPTPPPPRRPAEGFEDPPEIEDEPESEPPNWDEEGDEDEEPEEETHDPRRSRRQSFPEPAETGLAVRGGSGGAPDLTGLSPEEMKAAVIAWIRADPSRKNDVMGMLPDLTNELS